MCAPKSPKVKWLKLFRHRLIYTEKLCWVNYVLTFCCNTISQSQYEYSFVRIIFLIQIYSDIHSYRFLDINIFENLYSSHLGLGLEKYRKIYCLDVLKPICTSGNKNKCQSNCRRKGYKFRCLLRPRRRSKTNQPYMY